MSDKRYTEMSSHLAMACNQLMCAAGSLEKYLELLDPEIPLEAFVAGSVRRDLELVEGIAGDLSPQMKVSE